MGCKGSQVRILSPRPIFSNADLGLPLCARWRALIPSIRRVANAGRASLEIELGSKHHARPHHRPVCCCTVHSRLRLDGAAATGCKTASAGGRAGHAARAGASASATATITSETGSAYITPGRIKRCATSGHPEGQTADTGRDTGAEHSAQACSGSSAAAAGCSARGGAP